ncbi:Peroxisomal membrane protein [Trichinella spiralis]|uniref:Peroxisomal membrane protein n=1 Tax=Trichinella spiralis TaxID=6334 RepID=A0ABR3K579_TRISP
MGTKNTVHVTSHEELEFMTAFNRTMVETLESRKKLETGKNRTVISRTGRDSSNCDNAASWWYCQPSNLKAAFNRASQRTVIDSVHRRREDVRN